MSLAGLTSVADAAVDIIAQEGDAAPDGNGTFSAFTSNSAVLNDAGQVGFEGFFIGTSGGSLDNGGIFRGDGVTLTQIARKAAAPPGGNGTFSGFDNPAINDAGQLAFEGFLTGTSGGSLDDGGIYRGSGGSLIQIAREGAAPPEGNGTFSSSAFYTPIFNDLGQIAFRANLTGTSGGSLDDHGVYVYTSGVLTRIARDGDPAHDGDGVFGLSGIQSNPAINNLGQVTFAADYSGNSGGTGEDGIVLRGTNSSDLIEIAREGDSTPGGNGTLGGSFTGTGINDFGRVTFRSSLIQGSSGGTLDDDGVFTSTGGTLTEILREGEPTPDGNGVFSSITASVFPINNSNRVGIRNSLRDTIGGSSDNSGYFSSSGGSITQIAREGQSAPDGNGVFGHISSNMALNNLNHVAFVEDLTGTSGGAADNLGVFISDGVEIVRVVREGQALAGSTVSSVGFAAGVDEERSGLNDFGQVAFYASLVNGNSLIGLWTPDLHWREDGSGFWSTDGNWTLGIEPDPLYDTFIDPNGSATVTGNITDTVKSLTVGSTGTGLGTLDMTSGDVHSLGDITINAAGKIEVGTGRMLSGNTLTNRGILTGDGIVDATLDNRLGGEVRVEGGDTLHFVDAGTTHGNVEGTVEVIGGEIEFDGALTNSSEFNVIGGTARFAGVFANVNSVGSLTGRDALLRFDGGLSNFGGIGFTTGISDVFGDITNGPTGNIVISGASTATFYDDLFNDGNITTSTGSTSVFFGSVSGGGNFPGGGTTFFECDLAPGASPATVSFGGDVVLGPFSKTLIELGCTAPGSEHDQLDVTGDLSAGGTLNVVLIDAGGGVHDPQAGNIFDIFNFSSFTGDFSTINLPSLAGSNPDLRWHLNKLKTTGELITTFIADLNADFTVDIADLGLVGGQWGTDGTGFPSGFNADINGDGVVDVADLGQMGGQ
ncbi:MAG: hypothetical protein CMJ49_02220 [Planctomycetaceae bacterium]|nr:hypothetical protein [Planctomycetaceae bacterium]